MYVDGAIGATGVGFMEGVKGALTSTFTGGPRETIAPQLKQYFASIELGVPQAGHVDMLKSQHTLASSIS